MILIISSHKDQSTNDVINWLISQNQSFIRLNEEDIIEQIQFVDEGIIVKTITNKVIILSVLTGYWYRRGMLRLSIPTLTGNNHEILNEAIENFRNKEVAKLLDFLYFCFEEVKNTLTIYSLIHPNKLRILQYAKEVGLITPKTIISTNKNDLENFMKTYFNCITKPISEILFLNIDDTVYKTLTAEVDSASLHNLEDTNNFPSLLQENIVKKYELRVFYLKGKCYSMAIFSQSDSQTEVDFRNYNKTLPNRNVPYQLPDHISEKIDILMCRLNYTTGSIDIIVDKNDNYIFLEINPIGQFGMVSYPCNYRLEKKLRVF